ncbi:hypothetical protein B0H14DRAFT_891237 [Mycena olivaceomarginata]|nr:hypothetical protein B0H14DRAFT_891237 [Mycena olivaceomarginata]
MPGPALSLFYLCTGTHTYVLPNNSNLRPNQPPRPRVTRCQPERNPYTANPRHAHTASSPFVAICDDPSSGLIPPNQLANDDD